MIAATPRAVTAPPDTVRRVTVAPIEEQLVPEPEEEPRELPPLTLTGDDEVDEALALLRSTTGAIHEAQDRVSELSDERKRLVLSLRRRTPPVLFRTIADAAGSTDQTIYKIHREATRDEEERAVATEAERLGYPTVEAYLVASLSTPDGEDVPAYVPPPDLHAVEAPQIPHPDEERNPPGS